MNTITESPRATLLLRVSAVLWLVWGLVHMLGGVLTMSQDTTAAVQGIADDVEPASLEMDYPDAVGAVINQHGFNLFWIGLVTLICAVFIWRRSTTAAFLAALVGGLADIGYFLFLDLGGYVKFLPGTLMTIFSSVAIVTSFVAYFNDSDRTTKRTSHPILKERRSQRGARSPAARRRSTHDVCGCLIVTSAKKSDRFLW